MKTILFSALLGFAGLDPLGGMIVMSALSQRVPKAQILKFAITVLFSIAALAVVFSLTIGTGLRRATETMVQGLNVLYVILDFAIAIAAGIWFVKRVFFKKKPSDEAARKEPKFDGFLKKGMPLAGVLLALWVITDPIFWAFISLMAKNESAVIGIVCTVIWTLVSQLPLAALTIAIILGAHEQLLAGIERFLDKNNRSEKISRVVRWGINLVAFAIMAYCIVEVVIFLTTGVWI